MKSLINRIKPRHDKRRSAGITLVELMVSLALSLILVLIAVSLLLSSQTAYTAIDDATAAQENGRHAIDILARTLRQAGYDDWNGSVARITQPGDSPSISGMDARSLKSTSEALDSPQTKAINGSDVLSVRFHGAGAGEQGDGTMLNCAGFGVGALDAKSGSTAERAWSIFFVAEDATGEPELRCKYRGKSGWTAVAIARGVESFQVLYGVDTDKDGISNQFLTAREIEKLDDELVLDGEDSAARAIDKNRKTHWKKVVAVRVALLVRGSHPARPDQPGKVYDLFGQEYGNVYGSVDIGTRISENKLSASSRNRIRKVFSAKIVLRNSLAGGYS